MVKEFLNLIILTSFTKYLLNWSISRNIYWISPRFWWTPKLNETAHLNVLYLQLEKSWVKETINWALTRKQKNKEVVIDIPREVKQRQDQFQALQLLSFCQVFVKIVKQVKLLNLSKWYKLTKHLQKCKSLKVWIKDENSQQHSIVGLVLLHFS
jgi:hypothetical protein